MMKRIATLILITTAPLLLLLVVSRQIVTAQPSLVDAPLLAPDANSLLTSAVWQPGANVLEPFSLTITVENSTIYTFTDLLLTATIPSNATFVGGGNLVGKEVHYLIPTLAPGCCASASFFFTATGAIGTNNYKVTAAPQSGGLTAFNDSIAPRWNNWSWATSTTVTTSVVYTGTAALAVRHRASFAGLYLHGEEPVETDDIAAVRFWIHGGNVGGQNLAARLEYPDGSFSNGVVISPNAGSWQEITIPLAAFGGGSGAQGIIIQSRLFTPQPVYYLDEIAFIPSQLKTNLTATDILLPQLQIAKQGPATAASGEPFTYSIAVGNAGPGSASNLIITDMLPVDAHYISGGTRVGNHVQFGISSLSANMTATVQFVVSATQSVLNDSYRVDSAGGYSATGDVAVSTTILSPTLGISKQGPESVVVGQPIVYRLTISNTGTTPATDLIVTDTVPAATTYLSGGSHSNGLVSWQVPVVNPGTPVDLFFTVMPTTPVSFPASVVNDDYAVVAQGGYSAVGQESVVTRVLGSQLAISKAGPASVNLGQVMTYTLVITNSGTLTATDVTIRDFIPDGTIYQSGGTLSGSNVTFTVPAIGLGTTITRQFSVIPDPQTAPFLGTLFNSNYGLSYDGIVISGTEVVTTTVAFPDLAIDKSGPAEVTANDPIVYELTVVNNGLMGASNLVITDTLPTGSIFVAADAGGVLNGDEITWMLDTLAAGVTATFHFTVTADLTIINDQYGVVSTFAAANGSNVVVTIVGPAGFFVHLPLITNHADGSEPNDSCSDAYALQLNRRYNFHPDDINDFYVFDLPSMANLDIFLTNFFPINGQIVLYHAPDCGSLQFIASNGDFSATKTINAGVQPAGRYLIWVINDGPTSSAQMYSLEVSSP